MAIIVEEEKNRTNLIRIVGWVVFLGIVAAAVYYIFFASPELVMITPTANLSAITPIANVNLSPEDVLNSKIFQGLQTSVPAPSPSGPATVGRANPFIAP